jgi:hypothetical protein
MIRIGGPTIKTDRRLAYGIPELLSRHDQIAGSA